MSARDDYQWLAHVAGFLTRDEARDQVNAALDEIDRLRSWDGLMSILDDHYPADVFDGSSGDPGPRIIVLIREIDRIRVGLS